MQLTLTPPGLPPIKQYELWHLWRKIVPDEHKDITCPKQSDKVLKKYKEKNENKKTKTKTEADADILHEDDPPTVEDLEGIFGKLELNE